MFFGLGRIYLRGDEPIYSYAVDQMLVNGDWLTPRSIPQQTPFLEKPPLKFWLIAAGIRSHLLPANEFGHRFWDALFGAIAFLYVFAIGKRMAGPFAGLMAVLVLFADQTLLFEHGLRSNNMEAALVLAYCGGVYHTIAWAATRSDRARTWHPVAVGLYFTLGFMTKFVAVAFLPLVLAIVAVGEPSWRVRLRDDWRRWLVAIILSIALIAPWFVYQSLTHGEEIWQEIFVKHVVQRMRVSIEPGHIRPWDYYWRQLYEETTRSSTAPLIVAGLSLLTWHTLRRRWFLGALTLLWFFVPMVIISFGRSKLYHYVYPFLPPLALAAGYGAVVLFRWVSQVNLKVVRVQLSPTLRRVFVGIAVVAFAVAVWTMVMGRFGIRVGDVMVFRNRSILRPLAVVVVLLVTTGQTRLAVKAALSLLVMAPLAGYIASAARLYEGRPLFQELRDCLRGQFPAGQTPRVYGHGDPGQWRYVYYFMPIGWDNPPVPDDARVLRDARMEGEYEPVLLMQADYDRLFPTGTDREVAAVHFDDHRLMLLPGRFAACDVAD